MHSYLFVGNDVAARNRAVENQLSELAVHPFDQVRPVGAQAHVGIAEIREFIRTLTLTPSQSACIAGVIEDADRLTAEAQASLLKTIEEPPVRAYVLLGVGTTEVLLPTIVSRCLIVRVGDTFHKETLIPIDLESSPGKLLRELSSLGKTKEEYVTVYDQLIRALNPRNHAALLHRLLQGRRTLINNVHPLTLLEHILLDKANPIRYNEF